MNFWADGLQERFLDNLHLHRKKRFFTVKATMSQQRSRAFRFYQRMPGSWQACRHSRDSCAAHLCTQCERRGTAQGFDKSFLCCRRDADDLQMIFCITVNICPGRPGLWSCSSGLRNTDVAQCSLHNLLISWLQVTLSLKHCLILYPNNINR